MSKASKSSASEHTQLEGYEGHFEDFGPYTVGFETYTADAARAPLFAGLPDDHCQCPHMGYVIKGRLKFVFADGTEGIYEPDDAYYAAPPTLYAGSEVVEFSPTVELQQTIEVVLAEHWGWESPDRNQSGLSQSSSSGRERGASAWRAGGRRPGLLPIPGSRGSLAAGPRR
jgi:hypothetical protein